MEMGSCVNVSFDLHIPGWKSDFAIYAGNLKTVIPKLLSDELIQRKQHLFRPFRRGFQKVPKLLEFFRNFPTQMEQLFKKEELTGKGECLKLHHA